MDTSNVRQRHEYGTCLCFSTMGRRKLRISICSISSPETSNVSSIMLPRRKYLSTKDFTNAFPSRQDKNAIASTISSNSINVIKDSMHEEFVAIQDDPLQSIDYCGFPYYRSNKSDNFQDAILVKDAGVSCNLLNNTIESDISISGVESYLVRQLKLEYNELSSITRKINAYTKDILNTLASRCRRKDQILRKLHVTSKHIMTSQCTNKTAGNPCLKWKFLNNMERNYQASKVDVSKSFPEKQIVKEKMHEDRKTRKLRVELDKALPEEFFELSPKYYDVLLRNYLITKREKVSDNTPSKASLRKTENFTPSDRLCKDRVADKSRKSLYTSKCNPVLTNWREVSRRKFPLKLSTSRDA